MLLLDGYPGRPESCIAFDRASEGQDRGEAFRLYLMPDV
jgi:hypothetical protein